MSDVSSDAEEGALPGESPRQPGEGGKQLQAAVIVDKKLTFEEASNCLNTFGKDESCMRYAYLRLSATDRKLTDIGIIVNFRHLLFVDVSGNYLTTETLEVISQLPFLIQLIAQRNLIDRPTLSAMPYLQDLSLSRNQIKDTLGINQPALEYLDLNYNQIYQADFEETLPELKELELRGNFLFEFAGRFPRSLQKLYLADNRIQRISDADTANFENLQVLHLRNNMIRKLDGFSAAMTNLKYLNLRGNGINKLRQFRKLQVLPKLDTLIIVENPVTGITGGEPEDNEAGADAEELGEDKEEIDQNRVALLVLLPNLIRINKSPVSFAEREEARVNFLSKFEEIMEEESSDDEVGPSSTGGILTDNEELEG